MICASDCYDRGLVVLLFTVAVLSAFSDNFDAAAPQPKCVNLTQLSDLKHCALLLAVDYDLAEKKSEPSLHKFRLEKERKKCTHVLAYIRGNNE